MKGLKKSGFLREPSHRRKRSTRLSRIVLLTFLVGIVATVGYVWERVQVVRQQVVISELKRQISQQKNDNEYLRVKVLALSRASHLDSLARELGFTDPSPGQIIRLSQ
jgi:cell division protein FtsL